MALTATDKKEIETMIRKEIRLIFKGKLYEENRNSDIISCINYGSNRTS